jgi:hypothetical protein
MNKLYRFLIVRRISLALMLQVAGFVTSMRNGDFFFAAFFFAGAVFSEYVTLTKFGRAE